MDTVVTVTEMKNRMNELLERAAAKLGNHLRLSLEQQRRLESLGKKSKQGILTEAEREELLQILHKLEEKSRERARDLGDMNDPDRVSTRRFWIAHQVHPRDLPSPRAAQDTS